MKRLAFVFAGILALSTFGAEEKSAAVAEDREANKPAAELEKDDDSGLSVSVELEVDSAYVYHGISFSDRPIASVCPCLEYSFNDSFHVGAWMWQLYDLSSRRRKEGMYGEWNEHDFMVYMGGEGWKSDDEKYAFNWMVGYYWEADVIYRRWRNEVDYLTATLSFDNPFITPYVEAYYEWRNVHTMFMDVGVKKSMGLDEIFGNEGLKDFDVEGKVGVTGGHKRALQYFCFSENVKTGVATGEARLSLGWKITEWARLSVFGAFCSVLNTRIMNDWKDYDYLPTYYKHEQMCYCGVKLEAGF